MKEIDRNEFIKEFLKVATAFQHDNEEINKKEMPVYFDALREYPLDAVIRAMRDSVQVCEYFPRVAQIVTAITKERREYKPEKNYKCEECRGVGFVTMYCKYNAARHHQVCPGEVKLPSSTDYAIKTGILEVITQEEYYNTPRAYSFAKPCNQCRQ